MKTNDLKKGDRVQLRNGWYATIFDNRKGNTRLATVEGFETETGSVYSHNIMRAIHTYPERPNVRGYTVIEHTPAQDDLRERVLGMGV